MLLILGGELDAADLLCPDLNPFSFLLLVLSEIACVRDAGGYSEGCPLPAQRISLTENPSSIGVGCARTYAPPVLFPLLIILLKPSCDPSWCAAAAYSSIYQADFFKDFSK
ncbi:hypothetical protein TNCV_700181 [Trichonephila clavipes]|nr:hypothetical protein TNCV_700181 [Trichonephila clavipes]